MGSISNFVDRIFTVPGQNAREERAENARNIANEQNRQINIQRERVGKETAALKAQTDLRQAQYNKSVARSQRGRIRGGIFGDDQPQPNNPLSPRLG